MGMTAAGFWLILGAGLTLLVGAIWADRRTRMRNGRTHLGAFDPKDAPEYVHISDLKSQKLPGLPPEVFSAEQNAPHLALRLLDTRFATYSGGNSVLYDASVLVLSDTGILEIREIVRVLQRAAASNTPLLLATTTVASDVHETLLANHLAGKLTLQVLCDDSADGAALRELALISAATLITHEDLIADDVPPEVYGHLALSVATADPVRAWVVKELVSPTGFEPALQP